MQRSRILGVLDGTNPKEASMADNKTLRGPQDSSRIAMGEDYEVAYWTDKFGVSQDKLQQAVDQYGSARETLR
jgi:hypothetical protein